MRKGLGWKEVNSTRWFLHLVGLFLFLFSMSGCGTDNPVATEETRTQTTQLDEALFDANPQLDIQGQTDHPVNRWSHLADTLGLSEEQVLELQAALKELATALRELRGLVHAGEMTMEEAIEAAQLLRQDFELRLQEILTPEQYELLLTLRPNLPGPHYPGRRGPNGGRSSASQFQGTLPLTEDDEVLVQVAPQTFILNTTQSGEITVHAEVPYSAVDTSSITLNGIPVTWTKADNRGELVAKFDESLVEAILEVPSTLLTLTGNRLDGTTFSGSDEVQVRP